MKITQYIAMGNLVLVVDDDPFLQRSLDRELHSGGYAVVLASDANQALVLVREMPDLCAVVSDLDLGPGMGGFEVLAAVRAMAPRLLRLLATGSKVDPQCVDQHLESGLIHAFIKKPWRAGEVCHAVRLAIEQHGQNGPASKGSAA
jgi:CheY-like chemotaxis protein